MIFHEAVPLTCRNVRRVKRLYGKSASGPGARCFVVRMLLPLPVNSACGFRDNHGRPSIHWHPARVKRDQVLLTVAG